jgi:hypothetical protein
MPPRTWSVGDTVRHATRPEWGYGKVSKAEATLHEGKPCQKLTNKFDRAVLKTLSTAFAELEASNAASMGGPGRGTGTNGSNGLDAGANGRDPGDSPTVTSATSSADLNDAFLPQAESIGDVLARLPDAATDPFRTLEARLRATLGLYRFQPTGASLLDWAASQTGLADPLGKCNRHELEAHFQRFRVRLDAHLVSLAKEAAKAEPGLLSRLRVDAPSQARSALDRLNTRR